MKPEESVHNYPKNHPVRIAIARQLQKVRHHEKFDHSRQRYDDERDAVDYFFTLRGLSATLNYIKQMVNAKKVLDIGVGDSRAVKEIARSTFGEGLKFVGTSLTRKSTHRYFLGQSNITLTSAEVLRGFQPDSLGGILGVYSLTYSISPEQTVARLNEVLTAGGLIKACFRVPGHALKLNSLTARPFINALLTHGYDVKDFQQIEISQDEKDAGICATHIVLAIKPHSGSSEKKRQTASEILDADRRTMKSDVEKFGFRF